ncbi:DUF2849 domain-containing protein [Aureimonas fodinaquatilis]|uniref:DUF2849 domain-containing protein n=1 Tax=Aureimonas fodinaquatilis TaxID=2565783 RepID=A0A5B0DS84_9HYPH|nr:DUF2849 domain-containing protein [Aureimonas fodinaquatilis]KAA0969664.1 DUF2849 domain-containing protein [Aureimonas fodinaquatilis]
MAKAAAADKYKGIQLPAVVSANHLLSGDVVFLTKSGWSPDPAQAQVATDLEAAEALDARGHEALRANLVVEPYLVAVRVEPDGYPQATHFREAIRQKGPSTHPDLGKQAEFRAHGKDSNVSV